MISKKYLLSYIEKIDRNTYTRNLKLQGDVDLLTIEIKRLKCEHPEYAHEEVYENGIFGKSVVGVGCKLCGKKLQAYSRDLETMLKERADFKQKEADRLRAKAEEISNEHNT